ncbi:MAG TPA: PilZ domain-containing protein [Desulfuromonadaceae bacterium]
MKEKRRSQRINCQGTGWLQFQDIQCFCRLKDVSLHGAMVSLKEMPAIPVQQGEKCCLRLYQDMDGHRYGDFVAQVIRFDPAGAGLEFTEVAGVSRDILEHLIRKEQRFFEGAHNIIALVREAAKLRGIELTDIHFDRGELIPDREVHTLRFSAGEHRSNVHLHRADIEGCYAQDGTAPARREIHRAMDRLHGLNRPQDS